LASFLLPLELSFRYLLESSSAACRYIARLGNVMGSVGNGTASDDIIVYVLEMGVSAASRRSVGIVERL
jgi:hypothetical protein